MKKFVLWLIIAALVLQLFPLTGAAAWTADSLLFDFTNDAVAQQRYSNAAYCGINYDTSGWIYDTTRVTGLQRDYSSGTLTMSVKPKAPGDYKDANGKYYSASQVIDGYFQSSCSRSSCVWTKTKEHRYWYNKCAGPKNCTAGSLRNNPKGVAEGELTCSKCDMDYCGLCGYEKISGSSKHLTRVYPVSASEKNEVVHPYIALSNGLNFNPSQTDIVTVRFKMSGCASPDGISVRVHYMADGDTNWNSNFFSCSVPASTATSNSYVTLNIPTNETFRNTTSVSSLRLMFYGVGGGDNAKITIDYIYVGQQSDGSLLFDFSNDNADLSRYAAFSYGGKNYAQASSWGSDSVAISNLSVNTAESKLVLQLPENGVSPAIRTWQGNTAAANLRYDASAADYMQLRVKMTDVTASGDLPPTVSLSFVTADTKDNTNIVSAAESVAYYVETHNALPSSVTVGSTVITMPQFSQMVSQVIVGLNTGSLPDKMTIPTAAAPPNPAESMTPGIVTKSEYVTSATNNMTFIANNQKAPNYVTFPSLGALRFENSVYTFCRILRLYRHTDSLPETISVAQWSAAKSSAADEALFTYTPTNSNQISSMTIPEKALTSGEYTCINLPLTENFADGKEVKGFVVGFKNMQGSSENAKIELDYIYIGPAENRPLCPINHTVQTDAAVPATCLQTGLTEGSHCSVCGEIIMEQQTIPAGGHTEQNDAAVAPTCTQTGLTAGTSCAVCGEVLSAQQIVPALGHDVVADEAVPATCTETGLTAGTHCSVCGETVKAQEERPKLGHDLSETVLSAPDCTNPGTKQYTCSRCDYTDTETISALGHTPNPAVEENRVEATCVAAGHYDTVVYCEVCHAEISRNTTELPPAGQHTPGTGATENYVAPTCVTPGSYEITAYCLVCGERVIRIPMTVPATGKHTAAAPVQENTIPATCTEAGSYESVTYCKDCGTELSRETVTISALGHQYGVPVDNADGTHTMTCTCGDSITEAHTFENGVCVCGAEEVTFGIVSASLRLDRDIDIIFNVAVPEDAQNIRLTVDTEDDTVILTDFEKDGTDLRFIYADLNPQQIGDLLTATLSARIDGRTKYDTLDDYSIRQYCINLLNNSKYSKDEKLHTLLSDLLVYGAAAQTYMDYKTDALVTDGLTLTPSTFAPISGKTVSFTGTADANTDWTGARLVLSDSVTMRLAFCAASTEKLSVKVRINGREETFTAFESDGAGKYYIDFKGIEATEFDDTVSASFYRNGGKLGRTVNYSVNTYICSTQYSTDTNLQTLVRTLYNYGETAKAYSLAN